MKIALFHDLPSGGASRVAYELTRRLSPDHQVDVYTMSTAGDSLWDLSSQARETYTYRYEPPQHDGWRRAAPVRLVTDYRSLFSELPTLHRRIAADIDRRGYDLVLAHASQFTQAPYLLNDLSTPSVYMCHEPRRQSFEFLLRPSAQGARLAYRLRLRAFEARQTEADVAATRAATLVLANSFYSAESIQRAYGVTARVLYPGVDLDQFRCLDLPRDKTVVSVGGLHPFKGHGLVIAAVGAMPGDERPSVQIVTDRGGEAEAADLQGQAARLGVDLAIRRRLTDDELVETYNRAAAAVCAAHLEPFGLVPLEAMACGTPVVAVSEGGFRETVVDGRNGFLVERDPAAMAAGLQRVLAPEVWDDLHLGALADVGRWSFDAAASHFLELAEDLLAHRRAQGARA